MPTFVGPDKNLSVKTFGQETLMCFTIHSKIIRSRHYTQLDREVPNSQQQVTLFKVCIVQGLQAISAIAVDNQMQERLTKQLPKGIILLRMK